MKNESQHFDCASTTIEFYIVFLCNNNNSHSIFLSRFDGDCYEVLQSANKRSYLNEAMESLCTSRNVTSIHIHVTVTLQTCFCVATAFIWISMVSQQSMDSDMCWSCSRQVQELFIIEVLVVYSLVDLVMSTEYPIHQVSSPYDITKSSRNSLQIP